MAATVFLLAVVAAGVIPAGMTLQYLICSKRVTTVSVIVCVPSGWSWCKYMENSCWRFSWERNAHMQMYKWMQRLVGLGAVVAEDRFSALNWEHWQWKLFPLSKRTCRSFSGV